MISPCCKKAMAPGNGPVRGWQCPNCMNFAVNASIVKDALGEKRFATLWERLRSGKESGIPCPGCLQSMNVTSLDETRLEACPVCAIVWFDDGEWETARAGSPDRDDPTDRLDDAELRAHLALLQQARRETTPLLEEQGTRRRFRITFRRRPGTPS